jgi:hypothetical protein
MSLVEDLSDGVRLIQLMVRASSWLACAKFLILNNLKEIMGKPFDAESPSLRITIMTPVPKAIHPWDDTTKLLECAFRKQRTSIRH